MSAVPLFRQRGQAPVSLFGQVQFLDAGLVQSEDFECRAELRIDFQ